MNAAERTVAALGAERRGIVRVDLAHERGVTDDELETLRRRGVVISLGRGVARLRDYPFDWFSRLQGALDLAGPEAVVGLRSAARIRGFYRYRDAEAIEVLVPRGRDHRLRIGRLVQSRALLPAHVTWIEGLPVTTPARTFFDLCGDPEPGLVGGITHPFHRKAMERVANDAMARRGLSFIAEVAVLAALGRRGRRGTRLVREILMKFGPKYVPTHSEAESLFAELLDVWEMPSPERQVTMSDESGFIGRVDFVWRAAGVIVEVDSRWHDGPLDDESDIERDQRLKTVGWTVIRIRYGRLVEDQTAVRRELEAAIRK